MKTLYNFLNGIGMLMILGCGGGGGSAVNPPPPLPAAPVINAITPDNGAFNTLVAIQGGNFSNVVADHTVKFNGVNARVVTAAAAQLTVEVPKGAGTGPVSVTLRGQTVTGPVFNYTYTITVSTVAGGVKGYEDGPAATAKFSGPNGVAVDAQGNIYVADHYNDLIRKITPAGMVSTLAGSTAGFADGAGAAAKFRRPCGMCIDQQGNLYVTDAGNHMVRKVTPAGVVTRVAGNVVEGYEDGPGLNAKFFSPEHVCIDKQGNLYVAENNNYKIRKINTAGVVSTVAGSTWGYQDGAALSAKFYSPRGLAVDNDGNIYVSDYFNQKIRRISTAGIVSTVAGSTMGYQDGTGAGVQFEGPRGMVIDAKGNIYLVEDRIHTVRVMTPAGVVTTLSGNPRSDNPYGLVDGPAKDARWRTPMDICLDARGNMYVADFNNSAIRKITFE